ncbi:superoxide dismutase family protein [Ornithinibacillus scapharcae]|uniref:superoxide dismutase family protein n=1 Tax=Ornithinibacillus scapharcae TaxID=1147159 RepID=UPI000225B11C|nr:superoxide dismutase family protein [Ornithinibacillus scapharcae]
MKKEWLTAVVAISAIALLALFGLPGGDSKKESTVEKEDSSVPVNASMEEGGKSLLVTMINTKGETIGEARLEQKPDGVEINLDASKLPQGIHGFHIHENGSCDIPTFESAGGHFNPTNAKHGFDVPGGPHAGDLPNIQVKAYGNVSTSVLAEMVTLEKGKDNSLLKEGGTALIIHSKADDYKSQPAGNAGERIACGVIAE